ncbi:MAG: transporter [Planctomycetota bacterium]|nr:MAG: transporter [Planctomycetota bacterium]
MGVRKGTVSAAWAVALCAVVRAGPINSDVAFTPREGGGVLRLQYAFEEADGGRVVDHLSRSSVRGVLVLGLRANLAWITAVPYVHQRADVFNRRFGRSERQREGVGDVTLLLKYRFWQRDHGPMQTDRWAVLGGLQVRSGDRDFSSDSYDPIVGLVYTWRRRQAKFDADLVYQFNTGAGKARHDDLRYDATFSYRFYPTRYTSASTFDIDAVAELNGRYRTDGSHTLYLSPGLVVSFVRWSLEMSVQIPTLEEHVPGAAETDYRFVAGVRYRW